MNEAQRSRAEMLYGERVRTKGPWLDNYAAKNHDEYFARCTEAYFDEDNTKFGRPWLKENDPEMLRFLDELHQRKLNAHGGFQD